MIPVLIRILEALFIVGLAGSAIVILLSFIDDVETIFSDKH